VSAVAARWIGTADPPGDHPRGTANAFAAGTWHFPSIFAEPAGRFLRGNTHGDRCGPLQCPSDDSAGRNWVLEAGIGEPGGPGSFKNLAGHPAYLWRVPQQLAIRPHPLKPASTIDGELINLKSAGQSQWRCGTIEFLFSGPGIRAAVHPPTTACLEVSPSPTPAEPLCRALNCPGLAGPVPARGARTADRSRGSALLPARTSRSKPIRPAPLLIDAEIVEANRFTYLNCSARQSHDLRPLPSPLAG